MSNYNISTTCYTALLSNACSFCLYFLLMTSRILLVISVTYVNLPQCKLEYGRCFLQFREFIFKVDKLLSNWTQHTRVILIWFEISSLNHSRDVSTPDFERESFHTLRHATNEEKSYPFCKNWLEDGRLNKLVKQINPIDWLFREVNLSYTKQIFDSFLWCISWIRNQDRVIDNFPATIVWSQLVHLPRMHTTVAAPPTYLQ